MRLTESQRRAIREEVERCFGRGVTVRLFGSRTDDELRGGDIDLHIEARGTPAQLLDQELRLKARLMQRLGERRIDVVVHAAQSPLRSIDVQAQETGIPL